MTVEYAVIRLSVEQFKWIQTPPVTKLIFRDVVQMKNAAFGTQRPKTQALPSRPIFSFGGRDRSESDTIWSTTHGKHQLFSGMAKLVRRLAVNQKMRRFESYSRSQDCGALA